MAAFKISFSKERTAMAQQRASDFRPARPAAPEIIPEDAAPAELAELPSVSSEVPMALPDKKVTFSMPSKILGGGEKAKRIKQKHRVERKDKNESFSQKGVVAVIKTVIFRETRRRRTKATARRRTNQRKNIIERARSLGDPGQKASFHFSKSSMLEFLL
jgi:hypothetical protein